MYLGTRLLNFVIVDAVALGDAGHLPLTGQTDQRKVIQCQAKTSKLEAIMYSYSNPCSIEGWKIKLCCLITRKVKPFL